MPEEMAKPLYNEEIKNATSFLKNNKSTTYNLVAEQIKYGPDVLHENISQIFNEISITGKFPTELGGKGFLISLQKSGI